MACDRCKNLSDEFKVDSPFSLRSALRVVRDNLADKTIRIERLTGDITPDSPSPRIDGVFACTTCNDRWSLGVSTVGDIRGAWEPLTPPVRDPEYQRQMDAQERALRISNARPPDPVKEVTAATLRRSLKKDGLGKYADALLALARPCIQLEPVPSDPPSVELGQSHVGGNPYLPVDFDWPKFKGRPLTFLCQINLAVIHEVFPDTLPALPHKGLLSFFYDIEDIADGSSPEHRGASFVNHCNGRTKLSLCEGKEGEESVQPDCHVLRFVRGLTLPSPSDPDIEAVEATMSEEDQGRYFDFVQSVSLDHHLMGYPGLLQSHDMRKDCVAHAGLPRRKGLGLDAWHLLLQLGGDTHPLGLPWADARLYFWIREDDLAAARFDRCWTTFEST